MTLVEVLVAVLILGLTLGAGIGALTAHRRMAEAANRQTAAMHQARAVMEEITRLSFHHADLSWGTHALAGGGRYQVGICYPFNFTLKRVTVSIPWPGGDPGTDREPVVSVTTVISEALHP